MGSSYRLSTADCRPGNPIPYRVHRLSTSVWASRLRPPLASARSTLDRAGNPPGWPCAAQSTPRVQPRSARTYGLRALAWATANAAARTADAALFRPSRHHPSAAHARPARERPGIRLSAVPFDGGLLRQPVPPFGQFLAVELNGVGRRLVKGGANRAFRHAWPRQEWSILVQVVRRDQRL